MNDPSALRLLRQRLFDPVAEEEYDALFRAMSPVRVPYWSEPGCPPRLPRRARFDDRAYNNDRRAGREILKGRFMGGSVGYVEPGELELFACAYRKEPANFTREMLEIMELLRAEGPMNIGMMKEITGMLVKRISPAVHKLQEAFLLFEDQVDGEDDRVFNLFEREFPEIDLTRYGRIEAISRIIPRFIYLNVFATERAIRSYYQFSARDIAGAVSLLIERGEAACAECEGQRGILLAEDAGRDLGGAAARGIVALNRNDFLVKAVEHKLKPRYAHPEWNVLNYLLIDGAVRGAVMGRFRFGPNEIEDIALDLNDAEKAARMDEILDAVYTLYSRADSPARRYDGREITL